jgi:DNA-binding Lrp family transcriptional regulator
VDSIDRAIIDQLRRDGRQSNLELAEAVGLTPSPCLRRVKRLESEGIITGYHASFAPAAIDRGFEVLVAIKLADQSPATTKKFETELIACPEVVEARRMFGSPDFEVVIATKDVAAYELFLSTKILTLPGIGTIRSRFPMTIIKSDSDPSRVRRI